MRAIIIKNNNLYLTYNEQYQITGKHTTQLEALSAANKYDIKLVNLTSKIGQDIIAHLPHPPTN